MFLGICPVRNEEEIIQDTLDHVAPNVDGIVIYDDCSTDNTAEICREHDAVIAVVEGKTWSPGVAAVRDIRQAALTKALEFNPEWIFCFDADERHEWPQTDDWKSKEALVMRAFDFYITPEDVDLHYTERKWMGPEYRDIFMAYRTWPRMRFRFLDQRELFIPSSFRVVRDGFIKHYGKAISVQQFEDTCDFYATHFPPRYSEKWKKRKGQAVHTKSDFGRELIQWEDRFTKAIRNNGRMVDNSNNR